MGRYLGTYKVRWTDKNGDKHSKTYDDYATAIKAKHYLIERGADNIDIAVSVENKVKND